VVSSISFGIIPNAACGVRLECYYLRSSAGRRQYLTGGFAGRIQQPILLRKVPPIVKENPDSSIVVACWPLMLSAQYSDQDGGGPCVINQTAPAKGAKQPPILKPDARGVRNGGPARSSLTHGREDVRQCCISYLVLLLLAVDGHKIGGRVLKEPRRAVRRLA